MIKSTIYILACITTFLVVVSCVDADPLRPDGPVLEVDSVDIVFEDALFTSQQVAKSIELTNTGDAPLEITSVEISDDDTNDLSEFVATLNTMVLPVNGKTMLTVSFQPSEFRRYNRDLIIKSNSENDLLIRLEGTGVPKVANQDIWDFTSQFAIDQFEKEAYDIVNTKEVYISSTTNALDPVINLSALSVIKEVEILHIFENNTLTDLTGLGDLGVKEELIVRQNQTLESLTQLNGLVSSSSLDIELEDNNGLLSLDFLNGLTIIGDLKVINNRLIKDFKGAETIETIDGDFVVFENRSLTSLDGLQGISVTVRDDLSDEDRFVDDISIRDNPKLNNFCSLLNILSGSQDFFGDIIIADNEIEMSIEQLQMGICN